MNTCIFSGTIFTDKNHGDIELKTIGQGDKAFNTCSFKVYQYEKTNKLDAQGQPVYDSTFIPCKAMGKTAENIAKYFGFGKGIIIYGKYETYEMQVKGPNGQPEVDQYGKPRMTYGHVFKVTSFDFPPRDKQEVSNNFNNMATGQQINNQGQFSGQATFQQQPQQPAFNQFSNQANNAGQANMYGFDANSKPWGN